MASVRHIRYKARGERREKFEASLMVTRADGKRVQERKIFAANEQANEWLAERQQEIREGVAARSAPITLSEAVDRVIATARARGNRSAAQMEQLWKRQLLPYFGGKTRVTQITAEMIRRYESDILAQPHPRLRLAITISTVNRHKSVIRRLLRLAKVWGYIRDVPHIEMGREPDHRNRYLELDEMKRLLDACRASANPDLYDVVAVALRTGMRRGEILGLTWARVDFSRGVIILVRTKNGRRRDVPMSEEVYAILRERREKAKDPDGPCSATHRAARGAR
jgi:integrase